MSIINSKKSAALKMLALKLSIDGIYNQKDISEEVRNYYDKGESNNEIDFSIYFANSSAEQAVSLITRNITTLAESTLRLYKTIQFLNATHFAFSMHTFLTKLYEKAPEYFCESKLKPEHLEELQNCINLHLNKKLS